MKFHKKYITKKLNLRGEAAEVMTAACNAAGKLPEGGFRGTEYLHSYQYTFIWEGPAFGDSQTCSVIIDY